MIKSEALNVLFMEQATNFCVMVSYMEVISIYQLTSTLTVITLFYFRQAKKMQQVCDKIVRLIMPRTLFLNVILFVSEEQIDGFISVAKLTLMCLAELIKLQQDQITLQREDSKYVLVAYNPLFFKFLRGAFSFSRNRRL